VSSGTHQIGAIWHYCTEKAKKVNFEENAEKMYILQMHILHYCTEKAKKCTYF